MISCCLKNPPKRGIKNRKKKTMEISNRTNNSHSWGTRNKTQKLINTGKILKATMMRRLNSST